MADSASWNGPRWELWGKVDSSRFFKSLSSTFPTATTLFLEGTPSPDIDDFLRSAAEPGPYLPDRQTAWPKGNLYRLRFDASTLTALAELAERHAEPEVCDHLHIYAGEVPLVYWHDAFDRASPMIVAAAADREHLQRLASGLGSDLWQFARPEQTRRDARDRVVLVIGISLLVLWAAAVATYYTVAMLEHIQLSPEARSVGGAEGIFGAFACAVSIPCGLALLVALWARSVRAVRGLRWVVVLGLVMAWFVPVAAFLEIFR
jgi:hypothetical protein